MALRPLRDRACAVGHGNIYTVTTRRLQSLAEDRGAWSVSMKIGSERPASLPCVSVKFLQVYFQEIRARQLKCPLCGARTCCSELWMVHDYGVPWYAWTGFGALANISDYQLPAGTVLIYFFKKLAKIRDPVTKGTSTLPEGWKRSRKPRPNIPYTNEVLSSSSKADLHWWWRISR